MKKSLLVFILIFSTNAMAEWSFVKSIGVGKTDVDIVDFQPLGALTTQTVRTVTFTSLNLSLTGVRGKLYVSANTELPFSTESYQFNDQGGDVVRSIKREDYGLTIGYNVYQSINVFGGYSYGSNRFLNASFTQPGVVNDVKETDRGLFLGGSYSHDFDQYGTLNATLAYALLGGEITSNAPSSLLTNNTGDTQGFSFTLTYSNKYDEDANYYVSIKVKNYEYTDVSGSGTAVDIVKEKNFFMISGGLNIF